MNKKTAAALPKYRFPEFNYNAEWSIILLGDICDPVEKRAGAKKYTLMSVTSGMGLVSQMEKFGREIAGSAYKNYIVIRRKNFAYNKSATKLFPEGYIAMLTDYDEAALPNSIFTCFRITDEQVCADFINHIFQSNYHGSWLRKFIAVGARAHGSLNIDDKHLWQMPIALPNLPEQQKIADCLMSLDELIAAENKKLEALKSQKKGLMQKLFPAEGKTVPEWRFPEFKDSGEWGVNELGSIGDIVTGKTPDTSDEALWNGDIQFVTPTDISENKYQLKTQRTVAYNSKVNVLPANSIMFTCIASVGKMAISVYPCITNQQINTLIPFNGFNNEYVYYALQKKSDVIKSTLANSTLPIINKTEFSKITVVIPKIKEEQQKIADCLSTLDKLIITQTEKIEALKLHKKGLMQGLFPSVQEVIE